MYVLSTTNPQKAKATRLYLFCVDRKCVTDRKAFIKSWENSKSDWLSASIQEQQIKRTFQSEYSDMECPKKLSYFSEGVR